jgi:hypothetical protein
MYKCIDVSSYLCLFIQIYIHLRIHNKYTYGFDIFIVMTYNLYPYLSLYIYIYRYDNYARKHVPGHKMGIISTIKVKHEQDLSTGGTQI